MRNRYTVGALFVAVLVVLSSLVLSNRMRFVFMPSVEGDTAEVSLKMPDGTAAEVTPVGQIGDYPFEVGALTRDIAESYEKLVRM